MIAFVYDVDREVDLDACDGLGHLAAAGHECVQHGQGHHAVGEEERVLGVVVVQWVLVVHLTADSTERRRWRVEADDGWRGLGVGKLLGA